MPIYEYRCASCGFQKEYLQKMNDALLTVCSECGAASFRKMVTAAGFQLKGSGWYATDFKNGPQAKAKPQNEPAGTSEGKTAAKSEDNASAKSDDKPAVKSDDKPAVKSGDNPAEAPSKKPDAAATPAISGAGAGAT